MTTAKDAFNGHTKGFQAAAQWDGERLRASRSSARAAHLVCAEHSRGREAISRLERFLSPEAVRPVAHSSAHGACFFVTASHAEARALSDNTQLGLLSIAPFPSALKVAPGVLEHGDDDDSHEQASQSQGGLATTHGRSMRMRNVEGLNVELSPGTLPARTPKAGAFIAQLLSDLMSESIDLHTANIWSDPGVTNGEHLTTPGGAVREKEWSMAAALVNELSVSARTTPGDICSWDSISVHHAANDLLLVSGAYLDRRGQGSHSCCLPFLLLGRTLLLELQLYYCLMLQYRYNSSLLYRCNSSTYSSLVGILLLSPLLHVRTGTAGVSFFANIWILCARTLVHLYDIIVLFL